MSGAPLPVAFLPGGPLVPDVVAAWGPAARRLALRLCSHPALPRLRLWDLGSPPDSPGLAVLGDERDLPWVDGACYFGPCPGEPSLRVPTTSIPVVPAHLLFRALRRAFPDLAPPLLLVPGDDHGRAFGLGEALGADAETLANWARPQGDKPGPSPDGPR